MCLESANGYINTCISCCFYLFLLSDLNTGTLDATSVQPITINLCYPSLCRSYTAYSIQPFISKHALVIFYDSCFPSQSGVGVWVAKGVSTWRWEVQSIRSQEGKFILLTIVSDFHFPQLARDAISSSA